MVLIVVVLVLDGLDFEDQDGRNALHSIVAEA
jgi:hypothetical protein